MFIWISNNFRIKQHSVNTKNKIFISIIRSIIVILIVISNPMVQAQEDADSCKNILMRFAKSNTLKDTEAFKRSTGNPANYVSPSIKHTDFEKIKKVITIARSYSPKKLLSLIPEEFYSGAKESVLKGKESIFTSLHSEFFHGTSFDNAISIFKNQRLELTNGVYNTGSASLAGTVRFYPLYMKITDPVRVHENTVFKIQLKESVKVLDLQRTGYETIDTKFDFYNAYHEWYIKNFDEIVENFKELRDLKAEMIKVDPEDGAHDFDELALNFEIFGQLLGADMLIVSRRYGQVMNEEYSLINPDVIDEILPHIGRDPREVDRVKIIDYSYGRNIESINE
jgi:hypothetical protein